MKFGQNGSWEDRFKLWVIRQRLLKSVLKGSRANRFKFWVLRHYVWFAVGFFGLLVVFIAFRGGKAGLSEWLTVLGTPFTFIYFVQMHRLEETRLFKELFDRFNKRYDKLNEKLNNIREAAASAALRPEDRSTLFDYFNLCGEEYLYFQLGYIPPEAWKAWYNGMRYFLEAPRIRKLWDEEAVSGSYYGLIFPNPKEYAKIEDITALPCHRAA